MATNGKSPLTEGELEGAAYLCLQAASFTDLSDLLGNNWRLQHHERKRRFEKALAMTKEGITSLSEMGLTALDCQWAASQASAAKDSAGWLSRFQEAERMLREAH